MITTRAVFLCLISLLCITYLTAFKSTHLSMIPQSISESIKIDYLLRTQSLTRAISTFIMSNLSSSLIPTTFPCVAILSCGYKIAPFHYNKLMSSLPCPASSYSILPSPVFNESSVQQDAQGIVNQLMPLLSEQSADRSSSPPLILLIGHSRGGATATLASSILTHSNAYKAIKPSSVLTILIDPVDSADHIATSSILLSTTYPSSDFPQTLIISTPYGGKSNYYNVAFDSSCAPIDRNAQVFYNTMKRCQHSTLYIILPTVGHLQVLDQKEKSSIASVCASNNKVKDEIVHSYISILIQQYIHSYIDYNKLTENRNVVYDTIHNIKDMKSDIDNMFKFKLSSNWLLYHVPDEVVI